MGITFYAFGLLASITVVVGYWAIGRRTHRLGLDYVKAKRLTSYVLWWGLCGSHVLYLVLLHRADLAQHPWLLLNPLYGIYSFGGIVSGVLASVWCAHHYKFTRPQVWLYLDAVGFVFPFCWTIARTGCALAHDHVGIASTSWIAVRFPAGPRLDLGLIEALFAAGSAVCFLLLDRLVLPAPFFFGLSLPAVAHEHRFDRKSVLFGGDLHGCESIQNEPAFVRCAGRSCGVFFPDPLPHIGYSPATPPLPASQEAKARVIDGSVLVGATTVYGGDFTCADAMLESQTSNASSR